MEKILSISLKLNFTQNTLGYYGLTDRQRPVSRVNLGDGNLTKLMNHLVRSFIFKATVYGKHEGYR